MNNGIIFESSSTTEVDIEIEENKKVSVNGSGNIPKNNNSYKPQEDSINNNVQELGENQIIKTGQGDFPEKNNIKDSQLEVSESDTEVKIETNLNRDLFWALHQYIENVSKSKMDSTPIHIDEIASRLAIIYEKIRKIVDWQDDNVLRRRAIERILKRVLFIKISGVSSYKPTDSNNLAQIVTTELIRGGHLPNDEVPSETMPIVSKALDKYLYFLEQSSSSLANVIDIKKQVNFANFWIEIAACEIEEILANPLKEHTIISTMTVLMDQRIKLIPPNTLSKDEKQIQIFIAVCRTLYNLDDAYIVYRLLNFQYDDWINPSNEELNKRFVETFEFWQNSKNLLNHSLSKDFKRVCDQNDTVFALLGDFLDQMKNDSEKIVHTIENKKKFIKEIGDAYDVRYKTLKGRLFRLGVFSTLSVFLSNWFTFYLLEVPLAKLFYENFSLFTAFIDFLIPTVLMFFLVIIIRPPSKANRKRVLDTVASFIYKNEKKKLYEINVKKKGKPFLKFIFAILYLFMTWVVFTFVGTAFYVAKLPMTSVIFDTMTIALTVFAAVVVRNKSKELNVDDKTSFMEFILDMISVPVAKVGSFLASKWKEYNIVAIFFNFVVETPFALLLDVIEGWSQYLKDRKAELR